MNPNALKQGRCPVCNAALHLGRYDAHCDVVTCTCGLVVSGPTLRDALPPPPDPNEVFAKALAESLANAERARSGGES